MISSACIRCLIGIQHYNNSDHAENAVLSVAVSFIAGTIARKHGGHVRDTYPFYCGFCVGLTKITKSVSRRSILRDAGPTERRVDVSALHSEKYFVK